MPETTQGQIVGSEDRMALRLEETPKIQQNLEQSESKKSRAN